MTRRGAGGWPVGGWAEAERRERRLGAMLFRLAVLACSILLVVFNSVSAARQTREGVLRTIVVDDFASSESTTLYRLETAAGVIPILPTAPVSATSGDKVQIQGRGEHGQLVGQVDALDQGGELGLSDQGGRTVAVVMLEFPDDPGEPSDLEYVREEMFTGTKSANAFFKEESDGRLWIEGRENPNGDFFGWYPIEPADSECDWGSWVGSGDRAAQEDGARLDEYDLIVYVLSRNDPTCSFGGIAFGGGQSIINGLRGGPLYTHELGHSMGLGHANGLQCFLDGEQVPISDDCAKLEYDDPFDVMGYIGEYRHNHGLFLRHLGLLPDGKVQEVTEDGVYSLRASLANTSETSVLTIPRSVDPGGELTASYDLEVREEGGTFENVDDASMHGVSIRLWDSTLGPHTSYLVDTGGGSEGDGFLDAPLLPGETFDDGRVRITTLSAANGSATVQIDLPLNSDFEPPTKPHISSLTPVPDGIELTWTESQDNLGVIRYRILRNGEEVGTSSDLQFLDVGAPYGLQAYTIYAEDEAGNRSLASDPESIFVGDDIAPSAPQGLSAVLLGEAHVKLQWDASRDDISIRRYLIYRDGELLYRTAKLSYVDIEPHPGTYTYVVFAEDTARNLSQESEEISFEVPDRFEPTTPTSLQAAAVPEGVELKWSGSTDNVGVAGYLVIRDGQEIATTSQTSFLDRGVSAGHHKYAVVAEDEAGLRSPATVAVSVEMPDLEPPSRPTMVRAALVPDGIELTWAASEDNVAVSSYSVLRDGVLVGQTANPSLFDPGVMPGLHAYVVYAEDAARNRSPSSDWSLVTVEQALAPIRLSSLTWRRGRGRRLIVVARTAPGSGPGRLELWVGPDRVSTGTDHHLKASIPLPRPWPSQIRVVAVAIGETSTDRIKRIIRRPARLRRP